VRAPRFLPTHAGARYTSAGVRHARAGANTRTELSSSTAFDKEEEVAVPNKRPGVKNEKQYEGLRKKGMSKERAAKISNTPNASSKGGKKSGGSRKKAS